MPMIDPAAVIQGATLIEGDSHVGAGAVIVNSYLDGVTVEPGARVIDSVLTADGRPHTHRCDSAGKYLSGGAPSRVAAGAEVRSSTLHNTAVGPRTRVEACALHECTLGADGRYESAKLVLTTAGDRVTVTGPTEISEAWLGHHATIDRCGYLEGVFANEFHRFVFEPATGTLRVTETLDLPHVSRYGMNAIHSTNSGKIFPQPGDILKGLGPPVRMWHDPILSHEPVMLGSCCWVSGWTKVVGLSVDPHPTPGALLADGLATYLMPFSVAGFGGEAVQGQVMTGELNNGYSVKRRAPAWVFTHAGDAVIRMVQRLAAAMGATDTADRIVLDAIDNGLALIRFTAAQKGCDIDAAGARRGWAGFLAAFRSALEAHRASGLWEFRGGEPVQWRMDGDRWVPRDPARLAAIDPAAPADQHTEAEILACAQPPLEHRMGVTADELGDTGEAAPRVSAEARVDPDARLGPGTVVTGDSVIEAGAFLFRAAVTNSTIRAGSRVLRSAVRDATVGRDCAVIAALVSNSSVGDGTTVTAARVADSQVADGSTLSPYADLMRVKAEFPVILGGAVRDTDIETVLMSMHMAGSAAGLRALPVTAEINGIRETICPVPMLGSGSRLLGGPGRPVEIEAAFIGSNVILEGGCFVGFGSFVLGRLTAAEGLLPFTVSFEPGADKDQLGGVLVQFANILITHIVGWTFQANGPERAHITAGLANAMIDEGRSAVLWEIARRAGAAQTYAPSPYTRFKSLALYTNEQLRAGLAAYEEHADGRWDMAFVDGELRFTGPGAWEIKHGAARWVPAAPGAAPGGNSAKP
ncbi:MAG: hypothetical protein ABIF71_05000 [Planctomycetota bacterium]